MKFLTHNGVMYLWAQIKKNLDKKVDKVSGKGLSANDYTTAEKNKLQGIATGANNYTHPQSHPASMITGLPTKLPADGGDAETSEKWKTVRNINGLLIDGSEDRANYGRCHTAASADIKPVSCPGFRLTEGAEITVDFTNGNTANEPRLKVNDTGALPILYRNVPIGRIEEGEVLTFRYEYNVWIITGRHITPSTENPRANGTASAGAIDTYSRGDHVHPLQESVSGNAGTATKLKNERSLSVIGDMDVMDRTVFDGTKDIKIPVRRKGCFVGQSGATAPSPWFEFASVTISGSVDCFIVFHVSSGYFHGGNSMEDAGVLKAYVRTGESVNIESAHLIWEYAASGIEPDNFRLSYQTTAVESGEMILVRLYVNIDSPYKHYHFNVLSEGKRDERGSFWRLYSRSAIGGNTSAVPGQIRSTLATLKNNVSNMLVPMYMGFQTLQGDKELILQIRKFTFGDDGHTQWMTWEEIGLTKNYADVLVLCQPMYSNAGDIVCISWERAGTEVGKDKSRFIAMSTGWKNFTGNLWVTYFVAGTN